jgi:sugar lactone lactonase YvrE
LLELLHGGGGGCASFRAMRKRVLALSLVLVGSSVAAILACVACGSSSNNSSQSPDAGGHTDGGGTADSPSESSPGTDSGDAGYTTLQFDPTGTGSPDAIYWDNTKQVLYIVDDVNNQVWTYTDANGFQKYAQVPDNPALDDAGHTKLNGVTELADGTLVVTRFGYGVGGALYTVSPDGGTATVPGVPPSRKRIEVTVDPTTGNIYSDSFTGGGGAAPAGEVETVNLATGTTAYATGFGKTVGLLVQSGSILVSDQTNNVIVAVPTDPSQLADGGAGLASGGAFATYANITAPDQLCAGPNGTVYTDEFQSSYDGGGPQVRQIWPDGGVTVPWPNIAFTSLDDVAYDSTNSRLFVVDSNGTTVRTIKILPVSQ